MEHEKEKDTKIIPHNFPSFVHINSKNFFVKVPPANHSLDIMCECTLQKKKENAIFIHEKKKITTIQMFQMNYIIRIIKRIFYATQRRVYLFLPRTLTYALSQSKLLMFRFFFCIQKSSKNFRIVVSIVKSCKVVVFLSAQLTPHSTAPQRSQPYSSKDVMPSTIMYLFYHHFPSFNLFILSLFISIIYTHFIIVLLSCMHTGSVNSLRRLLLCISDRSTR